MTATSPKKKPLEWHFFGLIFVCSLPAYYAIHRKFFIPCKFCAVLP